MSCNCVLGTRDFLQPDHVGKCDCKHFFANVAKNQFVRVHVKGGFVEGYFLRFTPSTVSLYNLVGGTLQPTEICCDDIVGVSVF